MGFIKELTGSDINKYKIWVFAPSLESNEENISYYYDFSQSIQEYTRVFSILNLEWVWQPITMGNFRSIIDTVVVEKNNSKVYPIVLNLCDGDEINGTPGVSVIKYLREKEIAFTGSDEYFYEITTSKITMKRLLDSSAVPIPSWTPIFNTNVSFAELSDKLSTPIILKPSISAGSMGVGVKNVIDNKPQFDNLLKEMFDGYRGWNLTAGGVVAESFINGPEFTVLISGSYNKPKDAIVYTPVERVFHHSLPDKEKFLSFDRLWEIYETETPMPDNQNFYEYEQAPSEFIEEIKRISWDAYVATKGMGYTRVDLRMDKETKRIYVLELNAQCGLSEDEDYTSTGAILRVSGVSFSQLVLQILNDALQRVEK